MTHLRVLLAPLAAALVSASIAFGCGGDETPGALPGQTRGGGGSGGHALDCVEGETCDACVPGERLVGDTCQPAGLPPDMPCEPGETLKEGACLAAGVPPDGCAPGFKHDGDGGCEAILPATRCPSGQMALMGETACREVSACGSAPYGNILTDNTTHFVDQAYTGGGSDGSQSKPWRTIQAGINAAAAGTTVAVAEGSYQEDVQLKDKTLTLWGRCPARVEIVGSSGGLATLEVLPGADNSLVRGFSLRGGNYGVISSGALGVRLEQMWVHDLPNEGVHIEASLGPASLTLRDSLVENVVTGGAVTLGSEMHVVDSVIRGVRESSVPRLAGLIFTPDAGGQRSTGSVTGCLIEDNSVRGIYVEGGGLPIDSSVIRGTHARADGASHAGLVAYEAMASSSNGLAVTRCLISDNAGAGVYLEGSHLTISETVIQNTRRDDNDGGGEALRAIASSRSSAATTPSSQLAMTSCLVDESAQVGIVIKGSEASIAATIIRNSVGTEDTGGAAILGQDDERLGRRSAITVDGSVLAGNHHAALWVAGTDLALYRSAVRDNAPGTAGGFGLGTVVDMNLDTGERSTLTMSESLVEGNTGGGIGIWSGDATIRDSVIRDTMLSSDGSRGIGLLGSQYPGGPPGSTLDLEGVLIHHNYNAGLQLGGSRATITGCQISDTMSLTDGRNGHGIDVVTWFGSETVAAATIASTLVARNRGTGLYIGDAKVEVSASHIVDTTVDGQGSFGDGILLASAVLRPAELRMRRVQVNGSARAGIASFGGWVGLRHSTLSCQAFDFDAEPEGAREAIFEDQGGNACGCPKPEGVCKQVSAKLRAPQPVDPPGEPGTAPSN